MDKSIPFSTSNEPKDLRIPCSLIITDANLAKNTETVRAKRKESHEFLKVATHVSTTGGSNEWYFSAPYK
jgi:hypothetical protein